MRVGIAAGLWFLLAIAVGKMRWLAAVPAPVIQATLIGLTVMLLVLYRKSTSVRDSISGLHSKTLILFHTTRFVGFYFLYLYGQGRLPYAFAVVGGWGDIAVAVTSLVVAVYPARVLVYLWNIIGLIDILFVVGTAANAGRHDPVSMRELTQLPLSLLPTFLVPLIIFGHLVIFDRLRSSVRVTRNGLS